MGDSCDLLPAAGILWVSGMGFGTCELNPGLCPLWFWWKPGLKEKMCPLRLQYRCHTPIAL